MLAGATLGLGLGLDWTETQAHDALKAQLRASEYLKAYDTARRAVEAFPDSVRLRHGGVLALARMGAVDRAKRLFCHWQLDGIDDDEEVLALWARLMKDEAGLLYGPARAAALIRAGEAYERAYHQGGGGYFPAINVASLNAMAGDFAAARSWARTARDLAKGEDSYFARATVAEALLVEGAPDEAAAALTEAAGLAQDDFAAISTTRRQLSALATLFGYDDQILQALAVPSVAHFCGHMLAPEGSDGRFPAEELPRVAAEIRAALSEERVGFAAGSLAGGADILFAEAILEAGGELDVVLPFEAREFVEVSVRSSGEDWVARFERCLAAAKDVHFVTEDAYLGHDALFNYASHYAIGLARLRAQMLDTRMCQIAVWDGQPTRPSDEAGTALDLTRGHALGLKQRVIASKPGAWGEISAVATVGRESSAGRTRRTMIFGDLKGFSRLSDAQLPAYVEHVLGTCARAIAHNSAHLTFQNTWGDGLFLVFDDLVAAAACAFDLQTALSELDHEALGLPDSLGLRLGMHYGPVFELEDPVLQRKNFFGFHVSRAARVEPIVPEGEVYVTEAAAAALVVDAPKRFRCDYVGRVPLAKGYGEFPMYALSRLPGRS